MWKWYQQIRKDARLYRWNSRELKRIQDHKDGTAACHIRTQDYRDGITEGNRRMQNYKDGLLVRHRWMQDYRDGIIKKQKAVSLHRWNSKEAYMDARFYRYRS